MESNIDMNELILDLPNLTSITSDGSSFKRPRIVTLSSLILNESWIDIPNLQTVNLPHSFWYTQTISIKSMFNDYWWIDVSPILATLVGIGNRMNNEVSNNLHQ